MYQIHPTDAASVQSMVNGSSSSILNIFLAVFPSIVVLIVLLAVFFFVFNLLLEHVKMLRMSEPERENYIKTREKENALEDKKNAEWEKVRDDWMSKGNQFIASQKADEYISKKYEGGITK